ncbi:MAG: gamma-glutamyltranspeptidase / glutathione hydrolase [Solirubrobacteraceae bacterium]|nr:gamma-glutamyltranspeptidase / glutathione hydrolase [Solirubrobacteraceae bacterium]
MRRLAAVLLLLLAVLVAPASAVVKAPKAKPTATGFGGAAASVDPYATRTAVNVLRRGGNAVDAAVAAAAVLGVVEPYSSGIGGGGFMVIRHRNGTIDTIDGRETAPAAFTEQSFQENGAPIDFDEAVSSGLGVGVPGTPATWSFALRRYGTQQLRRALGPAIRLAAKGFVVDATLQTQTEDNAERFADFPATAKIYLPGGQPIQAGDTLKNPDLAATYRRLARRGTTRGFYRGKLAAAIAKLVQHPVVREGATRNVRPGLMTAADLKAYRAIRRKPATTDWRGYKLAGMGPPSSGGSTVLEALNILEAFGAPAPTSSEELHRYLEASRLAFADRSAYLGDPAFTEVPLACLLSQDFADARQQLIGPTAAQSPVAAGDCPAPSGRGAGDNEGPNTTHLTVADARGNVVSYTFTIEQTGGSGMVVPGRGFLLNNELTDFDFSPGKPNSPAARKRPRSSMSPTLVLKDGKPIVALGSPGGSTIITTVLQILVDRFERGMTLPQAVADPRVSERNVGDTSDAEPAFLAGPDAAALGVLGHQFASIEELGAATGIEFKGGGRMQAVAEPVRRGGGSAMVARKRRHR